MFDALDGGGGEPPPLPGALPGTIGSILGRARVVVTPYPFGVSDADNLRIVSVNSAPGITIEIHGRTVVGGFESKPFRYVHTPNSNRTAKAEDFVLGAGLVTNLSVFAAGGSPLIGQTFVIIQLVRSMGAVAYVMGTLLAGYVTSTQGVGWPGSAIESSIEGGGYYRTIVGTQPAAGAGINETVPAGARWELCSLYAVLTTNGAVANRVVELDAFTGANAKVVSMSPVNQPASRSWGYIWGVGMLNTTRADGGSYNLPWPTPMALLAGDTIQSQAVGLQAGDQWNAPVYTVRELLEAQ